MKILFRFVAAAAAANANAAVFAVVFVYLINLNKSNLHIIVSPVRLKRISNNEFLISSSSRG